MIHWRATVRMPVATGPMASGGDAAEQFEPVQPGFERCLLGDEPIRAMRRVLPSDAEGLAAERARALRRSKALVGVPLALMALSLVVIVPIFAGAPKHANPFEIACLVLFPLALVSLAITYLLSRLELARVRAIDWRFNDKWILAFGGPDDDARYSLLVGWPSWVLVKDSMRRFPSSYFVFLASRFTEEESAKAHACIATVNALAAAPRVRPMTPSEEVEVEWLISCTPGVSEKERAWLFLFALGWIALSLSSPEFRAWPPPLWVWGVALVGGALLILMLRRIASAWFWRGLLRKDLDAKVIYIQADSEGRILEYLPISEYGWSVDGVPVPMGPSRAFYLREPRPSDRD